MEPTAIRSPVHPFRVAAWHTLFLVLALCGSLQWQRHLQQHAGMQTFQQQSAMVAQMLQDQITATPARGAVQDLGISNLRLKAVVDGSLPADHPSLLNSLTALKNRLGADIVYGMNTEGRVVIATRIDGTPSITGNLYAFRPYFRCALEGQLSVYPALGTTTLNRGLYYSAPIYAAHSASEEICNHIIGVVAIKMPFTGIDNLFKQSADIASLISPHGIVLTSSIAAWQLQSIPALRRVPVDDDTASTHPEYSSEFFRSHSFPIPIKLDHQAADWENDHYAAQTLPLELNDPAGKWTVLLLRNTDAWFPIAQALLTALIICALCLAVTVALYTHHRNRLTKASEIRAISEAAQTYQSIFNSTSDSLFVHHAESGKILDANESARKLYEYSLADLESLSLDGEFPYPPSVAGPALKAALEKRTQIITFQSHSKSGRLFWAQATFRTYTLHGTTRILASVHDITEQRTIHNALTASKELLEYEVKTRTAQLLQAQKMSAIGKFAERVAHDVTNAMSRIIGYVDIVRLKPEIENILESSLHEISTAAQEMCVLSSDLLVFSHPTPLKLSPMNLCRVVKGAENLIRASAPPLVEIIFHTPPNPLRVNLSANHIEQALTHLALNGFEAMQNRGTLTISLRRGESEDRPPSGGQGPTSPENLALLEVHDTGTGFSQAQLPHVFDPFFTTKTDSKRRGLGLTAVYLIIDSHHGWVNVLPASTTGGGGTVQIWLPLIDRERDL